MAQLLDIADTVDELKDIDSDEIIVENDDLNALESLLDGVEEEILDPSILETIKKEDGTFLGDFLRDLTRQPLLTHEQEIWLAVQIGAYDQIQFLINSCISSNLKNKNISIDIIQNLFEIFQNSVSKMKMLLNQDGIQYLDCGKVFSEIVEKRFKKEEPFPESLFSWLWDLNSTSHWNKELVKHVFDYVSCLLVLPLDILINLSSYSDSFDTIKFSNEEIKRIISSSKNIDIQIEELQALGELAKEKLIMSNTRLVISVAKKYASFDIFEDLIQEGILGLMRAIHKYKPEYSYKFSTYATWWIRQSISRYVAEKSRLIRIPVHMHDFFYRIAKVRDQLFQELHRPPTAEEIAEELGDVDPKKVAKALFYSIEPVSLDVSIKNEKDDGTIGDFIDSGAPDPEHEYYKNALSVAIKELLTTLSEREQKIILMRYGLLDDDAMTLEAISQTMGLTRERIRQIEAKSFRKLRHPTRSRHLIDF